MSNLVIISGSPRPESKSRSVAEHLHYRLLAEGNHELTFIDVARLQLPVIGSIITDPTKAPKELQAEARAILDADILILVSPEYNGSYAPSLKHLLDLFPKQRHKVFGLVTASVGSLGGVRAALQLQQLVFGLFGLGSPYLLLVPDVERKFSPTGVLLDEGFAKQVNLFLSELEWLGAQVAQSRSLAA